MSKKKEKLLQKSKTTNSLDALSAYKESCEEFKKLFRSKFKIFFAKQDSKDFKNSGSFIQILSILNLAEKSITIRADFQMGLL